MSDSVPNLTRAELHAIWAPDASVWSPWVKPVPFAFWPRALKSEPPVLRAEVSAAPFPSARSGHALVIDLPGGESVLCGADLATRGYRPVPIFASCPDDATVRGLHHCTVDAEAVITALAISATGLAQCPLCAGAPPAFLIDATRHAPGTPLNPQDFDNRSAVYASDFPSASLLRKEGITHVTVVRDSEPFGLDLSYVLDTWRHGGLEVEAIDLAGRSLTIPWPPASFLSAFFYRLQLALRLRPNPSGGYGRLWAGSAGG
ncbi:MAG: hypothetical protein JSS11_01295 [Verrucomicrobia bacterium]|nr:hypothetical protein [Verrucomicrobiota bacterium]